MSKFRNAVYAEQAHNRTLWIIIMLQFVANAYMWYGWNNSPQELKVHIPPDLSQGVTMNAGEISKANIYQFAYYIYQQLNRWENDGEDDYVNNIYRLQAFLTDNYRKELLKRAHEKLSQGELQARTRSVHQLSNSMYSDNRVKRIAKDVWTVVLDLRVQENHNSTGMMIKDATIVTPLRIVFKPIDLEKNPWGLVLDGGEENADRVKDTKA